MLSRTRASGPSSMLSTRRTMGACPFASTRTWDGPKSTKTFPNTPPVRTYRKATGFGRSVRQYSFHFSKSFSGMLSQISNTECCWTTSAFNAGAVLTLQNGLSSWILGTSRSARGFPTSASDKKKFVPKSWIFAGFGSIKVTAPRPCSTRFFTISTATPLQPTTSALIFVIFMVTSAPKAAFCRENLFKKASSPSALASMMSPVWSPPVPPPLQAQAGQTEPMQHCSQRGCSKTR
mmetsp:Transcript_15056/g.24656  ORF Transcript_15056/g.24656 Transcript_15056/m.24656 type:complete len:235 (+) Transcript_15056:236-940(+)